MKIKNFKTLVYEFPLKEKVVTSFGEMDSRPALILEVKTTDNIKGYGEIWCNWPIKSAYYKVNLVHKVFKYFIQDIKFSSPKSFYTTKKLIKTAADMKGVKMRTINSPLQIEFIKAMGGNPTPVAWGEVYTSLKSGVIEGTKNAATDIIPNNMHEVVKFVSLDEHADLYGFYWMSDKWLQSLPENYQNLVLEGVRQMAEIQSNWNKQYENQALMEFAASGGTIYVPTPEEKATFLPYRDIMADWFTEQYGPEYVEAWRAAIAQAEKEVAALNAQVLQ